VPNITLNAVPVPKRDRSVGRVPRRMCRPLKRTLSPPFFTRHCRAGLSYCAPSGLAYADQIPHNSLIASGNGSANTALGDRKLILDEEERRILVQRCGIGPSPMRIWLQRRSAT